MPTIRGRITAYDSGTHTATLRLDGSAPQTIASVRVAANIAGAAVTSGRRALIEAGPSSELKELLIIAVWDP